MATNRYEEERLRAQEQSQIVYLQGQIDELRRLIKDQTNKYNWAMEQVRKVEGAIEQVQEQFHRQSEQLAQSTEVQRREIAGLRKEVAGALLRIDEAARPIREMQSQIQQLAEARRQDRDQLAPWLARIEEVERRFLSLQAQLRESDERQRQLSGQLARFDGADAALAQDIRTLRDELQVEKQSLRRQAVEAQQLVADVRSTLDRHEARIEYLAGLRQQLDQLGETLPAQINQLGQQLPELTNELKRIERVSTERFLMNQERLEEVRRQSDERIVELRDSEDQQLRQLSAWIEKVDTWCREIETRLVRNVTELENRQSEQTDWLTTLEQSQLRVLDSLLNGLREQVELNHATQVERKRRTEEA